MSSGVGYHPLNHYQVHHQIHFIFKLSFLGTKFILLVNTIVWNHVICPLKYWLFKIQPKLNKSVTAVWLKFSLVVLVMMIISIFVQVKYSLGCMITKWLVKYLFYFILFYAFVSLEVLAGGMCRCRNWSWRVNSALKKTLSQCERVLYFSTLKGWLI